MGIPHVIVDNEIGKLGNYRSTWSEPIFAYAQQQT